MYLNNTYSRWLRRKKLKTKSFIVKIVKGGYHEKTYCCRKRTN